VIPVYAPSNTHWYVGLIPPFVGVGVNVTAAPAHVGFDPAVIAKATLGVTAVVTAITIELDVAVLAVKQGALEVTTQDTTFPFIGDDTVKVDPVPAFVPLIFHW
jgi:hypothetical protein